MLMNIIRSNLIQFAEGLKFFSANLMSIRKDFKIKKVVLNAFGGTIFSLFFSNLTIFVLIVFGIALFFGGIILIKAFFPDILTFSFTDFFNISTIISVIILLAILFIVIVTIGALFNSLLKVYEYSFLSALFESLFRVYGSNFDENNKLSNVSYSAEINDGFKKAFIIMKNNFKALFLLSLEITIKNLLFLFISLLILLISALTIIGIIIAFPIIFVAFTFLILALEASVFIYLFDQIRSEKISLNDKIKLSFNRHEFSEIFNKVLKYINGSYIAIVVFPMLLFVIITEVAFFPISIISEFVSDNPKSFLEIILFLIIILLNFFSVILKIAIYSFLKAYLNLLYALYLLNKNEDANKNPL